MYTATSRHTYLHGFDKSLETKGGASDEFTVTEKQVWSIRQQ